MEDIKIRTKNGGRYTQYEDMNPIKDSMQFDSDTEICSYVSPDKKFTITIEVRGEVRLTYKDETYTKPSEFPQEVKEIIKNGDCGILMRFILEITTGLSYLFGIVTAIILTRML